MERPILFNTEMVKAILSGQKTQTRRIIKPQPKHDIPMGFIFAGGSKKDIGKFMFGDSASGYTNGADYIKPPYQVGDTLWVRETWCQLWAMEDDMVTLKEGTEKYYYAADGYNPTPFNSFPDENGYCGDRSCPKWKPSIHMPRAAARLFLKVTNVRVERLQDITEEDANREGFEDGPCLEALDIFESTWNGIYGNWNENPWVWVIEFERMV